jgi:hypothetical protein
MRNRGNFNIRLKALDDRRDRAMGDKGEGQDAESNRLSFFSGSGRRLDGTGLDTRAGQVAF